MRIVHTARRVSYVFLCMVPFLAIVFTAIRPLRIPGVYQAIGGVLFAAIVIAAWILGARVIGSGAEGVRILALAGGLLIAPWAIVSLLWVGLGPPWVATAAQNQMRYLVLIVGSMTVAGGFVVLKEALSEAGERFSSTLGFAAIMLGGPLYLIWNTFVFGAYFAKEHAGQVPPAIASLDVVLNLVLFLGGALTYFATAAFAASLGRAGWLGRKATGAYIIINFVALLFLAIRGLQFPDPKALSAPWYTSPGFVVGIPAVPWIMPSLLGVVLLRRAGEEQP